MLREVLKRLKVFIAGMAMLSLIPVLLAIGIYIGYETGVTDTIDWMKWKLDQKGGAPILIYEIPDDRPQLFRSHEIGTE